jgi:hypothetical protein
MSSIRMKGNNYWMFTTVWLGAVSMIGTYMVFRRVGLGSDWPRVKYNATVGEYRMLLEPGSVSDNRYLPPHMRLDQVSYLDVCGTELAPPPAVDMTMSETDMLRTMDAVLPEEDKKNIKWKIGPMRSEGMMHKVHQKERFVVRRLGMTPDDKEKSVDPLGGAM